MPVCSCPKTRTTFLAHWNAGSGVDSAVCTLANHVSTKAIEQQHESSELTLIRCKRQAGVARLLQANKAVPSPLPF